MHLGKHPRQLRWRIHLSRTFGYQIPAPPPPLRQPPRVTTFSDTARPRPYLVRKSELPAIKGGLPLIKKTWSAVIACGIASVSMFWTYITNKETSSSTIMQVLH
ncbi:hypothetical protein EDD85DRAFT_821599 [Armillaria nabsnona]|nr:hypothetical protein EDD85DRAFT_821599 [Armillaria nabsnona]